MASRAFRIAVVVFLLAPAFAARAEGKCGDYPVPKGPADELVVTWAIPYPRGAEAGIDGPSIFKKADAALGTSLPPQYTGPKNPTSVRLFGDRALDTVEELVRWEKDYEIEVPHESEKALREYKDHRFRGAIVEHPHVQNNKEYTICTCMLQRGVLVFDGARERLWVRSRFHTTDGKKPRAFEPGSGWWFRFDSKTIWFPLRLNALQKERAWMVLDVFAPRQFKDIKAAKWGLDVVEVKRTARPVKLFNNEPPYHGVRLFRAFKVGEAVADLDVDPADVLQ